jgi:predicted membrane protein
MNNILDLDKIWKLIVPSIIVIIGLSLIFKNSFNSKVNDKINKLNKEKNSDDNYFAAFSGQDVNLSNKKFNGSDITACLGGIKLDLREAIIEKDIVINASSIFGGINILVPEDVNVIVKSTSIFGGVTNKKENTNSKKNIYINAMCMFGGVDIK